MLRSFFQIALLAGWLVVGIVAATHSFAQEGGIGSSVTIAQIGNENMMEAVIEEGEQNTLEVTQNGDQNATVLGLTGSMNVGSVLQAGLAHEATISRCCRPSGWKFSALGAGR